MRTSPWVGGKLPAMTLTKVDLPAPLSPMRPRTSPDSSVMSTSLSAWMAPKCLDTDCNSRIGNPVSSASAHATLLPRPKGRGSICVIVLPSTRSARRARGAALFPSRRGHSSRDGSDAYQVRARAMSGRGSAAGARGNRGRQARPSRAARLTARELARPLARNYRRARASRGRRQRR
jgi:hypothetical protein